MTDLSVSGFVERAERKAGVGAVPGRDSWREGLDLIATAFTDERVTAGGRSMLAAEAVNYLANRFLVDDWHSRHPHLADTAVEEPVFILGLPRTGTTVVSYLLDQDPQWRSLLNWEAVMSVPPPTTDTLRSDPRCLEMLEFQRAVLPGLDPPPPHWEWADGPTECTFLLAQDFRSAMWDTRLPSPAYREFIETCDMAPAYRHHRRTLQVLQSEAPGRWMLKMPAHAYFIDGLLEVYPDARIIWMHRDPVTAVASFLDLAGFGQALSLGTPDADWIRTTYPRRLGDYIRRAESALADRDVHHVQYTDVTADPIGVIGGIYQWLGVELDASVEAGMRQWILDDPIRKPRKRPYALADWDLTVDDLDPVFGEYAARYGGESSL